MTALQELKAHLAQYQIDPDSLKLIREIVVSVYPEYARTPQGKNENHNPMVIMASSPTNAVGLREQLMNWVTPIGYYPVLIGDAFDLRVLWQQVRDAKAPEHYIAESHRIDGQQWLVKHRMKNWPDVYISGENPKQPLENLEAMDEIRGEWIPSQPWDKFPVFERANQGAPPIQYIGFVQTTEAWQTPAYLAFGNFNGHPAIPIFVVVCRYWEITHQAKVIVMNGDTIIFEVDNPVRTEHMAIEVAFEMIALCGDLLRLFGTVDAVASTLFDSRYWSLWFD